jgi:hypothetical protein
MTADLAKNANGIYERYALEWDADRGGNSYMPGMGMTSITSIEPPGMWKCG